jgi:hypothetical protein
LEYTIYFLATVLQAAPPRKHRWLVLQSWSWNFSLLECRKKIRGRRDGQERGRAGVKWEVNTRGKGGVKSNMRFGAIQQVNHMVVHPEARRAGFSRGLSVLSILLSSNCWNYLSLWNPILTILLDITQKYYQSQR